MSCSNNFKQIGLGLHNYHSAYKRLPAGCGGTGPTPGHDDWSNQRRLSPLIAISPFLYGGSPWSTIREQFVTSNRPPPFDPNEDHPLPRYDYAFESSLNELATVDGPFRNENGDYFFPEMGPAPWRASAYPPWQLGMYGFRCPSDATERPELHAALCNYALCYGDAVHEVGYEPGSPLEFRGHDADTTSQRGAFVSGRFLRFDDVTDGLANTVFMAEVVTFDGSRRAAGPVASNVSGLRDNPSLCLNTIEDGFYKSDIRLRMTPDGKASRGGNWADGAITWSGFNTILPPNSPSCDTETEPRFEGVFSASSNHQGGCHILMGDGTVAFITNSIDVGDPSRPTVYADNTLPRDTLTHNTLPRDTLPRNTLPRQADVAPGVWPAMGSIADSAKP